LKAFQNEFIVVALRGNSNEESMFTHAVAEEINVNAVVATIHLVRSLMDSDLN
jgi:hypothetical protein